MADPAPSIAVDIQRVMDASAAVEGWTRDEEAQALLRRAVDCPPNAELVEIGAFLGSGQILLAGGREIAGSGRVHCVDPFDGSGDTFSVPYYREIVGRFGSRSQRDLFDENIRRAGCAERIEVHQGRADEVAAGWTSPIDLLFLDGDQSPVGAETAYAAWEPFLKTGGLIAVHNSNPGPRAVDHDGYLRLVESEAFRAAFTSSTLVGSITFAVKAT